MPVRHLQAELARPAVEQTPTWRIASTDPGPFTSNLEAMGSIIALSVIAALGAFAVAAELPETVYQTDLRPLNMPPTWSNGFLAVFRPNGVSVYNPDGSFRYHVERSANDSIVNVALDTNGALTATQHHGPILVVDSTGALNRTIETPGFIPSSAAFAPDGTIWVNGVLKPDRTNIGADYNLLRHYNTTGELLGSYLPRSSFPTLDDPIQNVTALPDIHIAAGRIGILLKARTHVKSLWVETDLAGKELGRWNIAYDGHPITLAPDARVYARTVWEIFMLNREQRRWTPVPVNSPGILIGSERDTLVFVDRSQPRVYRLPAGHTGSTASLEKETPVQ